MADPNGEPQWQAPMSDRVASKIGMPGKVNVLVSVDEAEMIDFPSVLKDMVAAGLQIENEMALIGTVAGSVDSPKGLGRLRKVKGVSHVERCRPIQLAPPHADVQ